MNMAWGPRAPEVGPSHPVRTGPPTTRAMRDISTEFLERDMDLQEYNPQDWGLKARLLILIT